MKLLPAFSVLLATSTVAGSEVLRRGFGRDGDNEGNGNNNCPEYCDLYAQAIEACPYSVAQVAPDLQAEAALLESKGTCIGECVKSTFSKKDTSMLLHSFTSDSLQCRMKHARMAIKEGSLTNTLHCAHATLTSTGRCNEDASSQALKQQLDLGSYIFYNPAYWLGSSSPFAANPIQAVVLAVNYLIATRGRLYIDYPSDFEDKSGIDCSNTDLRYRSADGTCNSVGNPTMGSVGTSFTRNLDESLPHKNGYADVEQVAAILMRDADADGDEVAPFNQLTTAWIQFMTHDWFQHDKDEKPSLSMKNKVTHWWDASQIYGSTEDEVNALRTDGGKIHLDDNDEIDYIDANTPITGFRENWWAGLHVFHTIFAKEHNHLVDVLSSQYPGMSSDELYGTARNIIALILAKIHTLEWTPTLLDNEVSTIGLNINWYGLQAVVENFFQGNPVPPDIQGIVNSLKVPSVFNGEFPTDLTLFNTPFFMTEEFVSVYRMHPLLPDEIDVEGGTQSLNDIAFTDARTLVSDGAKTTEILLGSFLSTPARTLSLKNYPRELYDLDVGNGVTINLAEIDITRDRERGLPRYNDARRQLLLPPLESIEDLTDDAEERALLKSVYTDIEQVDFMVGCIVDKERPEGFAFGVVPYYIFLVMASRRLLSDRFFQEGLTVDNYTEVGIQYVVGTTFRDILLRHFPDLDDEIPQNPFGM
eukprot:CAMPEP_0183299132 /NCGR_PEP_ID=MMETSP0160_2-20130417/5938_1 /TAXON_ID=2839 ORGANISM="Odontella Sinensis, Strain Grunow 1884" /NCGR_SAMPLE_ID=MMETSP0160_2 /ASSEMBLY_ACC=CAM_ASM_000250 /LENGTH=701 /DNA_ID=CAMNT_0025461311 /DNA_START=72 /DNA_END=2177 /DNA_ORIENTATION=-